MSSYYRIMLGPKSIHAEQCHKENFIGANFDMDFDLTGKLPELWREFNQKFTPIWLAKHPGKSKISAGLACGFLYTIAKGIKLGDIVLCPNGSGSYLVGEIEGPYYYEAGTALPHRRRVKWRPDMINRADMSPALKNSAGSVGTVSDVTRYSEEIGRLIGGLVAPVLPDSSELIEDPLVFALEMHLEDFLIHNWKRTEFGKDYDIYEDENGSGKQYQTDDKGRIDILAISKNKKELLVVELKRGRASDVVVGQIQRYMGYVKEVLAEKNQEVKGVIIGLEDDIKIKRALSVTNNIIFYRYEVSFKLFKS